MLAYVPAARRAALELLWRLDERLASVVATTREPTVGRIRLAWWREALEALDRREPPAEPLLRDLAGAILPLGITGADLAAIEWGWAALLDSDPPDEEAIAVHGRERGGRLFDLAARMLAGETLPQASAAGAGWALTDLAYHLSDPPAREQAKRRALEQLDALADYRWPAALRPLGALAVLARRDAMADRRDQGAPGRVARMLMHRFTGR